MDDTLMEEQAPVAYLEEREVFLRIVVSIGAVDALLHRLGHIIDYLLEAYFFVCDSNVNGYNFEFIGPGKPAYRS